MIERGDIYYILCNKTTGSEQKGKRPAVVVSNDIGNAYSCVVEVVFLTTNLKRWLPTHAEIRSTPSRSKALCEQVTTIDKSRISDYIGKVTKEEMKNIEKAIKISLSIEESEGKEMQELKMIENELVPVYTTDTGEKVVYGTELFRALQSKRQYTDWIKTRLSECDAVQDVDYEGFSQKNEKPQGGRPTIEYIIKLDTAKEMAMLERNEIGKKVRKYFISVEKKYKTENKIVQGQELLALAILEAQKIIEEKEKLITEMQPKALFADAVATSKTSILIGDLAKILKQNGIETGQKRLFVWLRENEYLIKRKGTDYNMPTQKSMELGLFEVKESTINNPDGSVRINRTTKVTGKGQQYFINKFLKKAS